MATPVIVGAVRTAIGRSFKGTLVNTPPETLITAVLPEVVRRSGVDPSAIDDIIFAESHYGGGDLARYAATATGLEHVPGQSVNRHCAGSLTAIGNAAAQIGSGHGARAHRRRSAVAVDDAADELADSGSRAEVRGALDAARPTSRRRTRPPRTCRSPWAGTPRSRRHHPRGDGRLGGPFASARHRGHGRRQVRRRDPAAEDHPVRTVR